MADAIVPPAEESAETHDALCALLRHHRVTFTLLSHPPCKTSEESAAARGVPLACGAKAMLLRVGKGAGSSLVLAVLSAARRANLGALRGALSQKSVSLASPEDVWAATRCLPGAVPPFGSLFRDSGSPVRTLVDPSLLEQGPSICFNAALRGVSIINLPINEWVRIEAPQVMAFSAPLESTGTA